MGQSRVLGPRKHVVSKSQLAYPPEPLEFRSAEDVDDDALHSTKLHEPVNGVLNS